MLAALIDDDLSVKTLRDTLFKAGQALWLKHLDGDAVYNALVSLPGRLSLQEGLAQLFTLGLSAEEAVVVVDQVDDFSNLAVTVRALFRAIHNGDRAEVKGCLDVLGGHSTAIGERLIFVNGYFLNKRILQPVMLAPEHSDLQFFPIAPVLALLTTEVLQTGLADYIKPCRFCGNLFYTPRSDGQYCTDSCRAKMSVATRQASPQ